MRSQTATKPPNDRRAGRIAGVFGTKGELKIEATSAGCSVFKPGQALRFSQGDQSRDLTVWSVREHKTRQLVQFEGFDDVTSAAGLVGGELFAPRDAFTLGANEYLDEDLIGCQVRDENGRDLGTVNAIEHYPSQDMLVVSNGRIPLVGAFIERIDLMVRQIEVKLPPGLLD